MSIIKNTGIKRGDKLTATDLNAEFTSVNSAFKMDAENFRNEAIDSPSLKGVGASGQAGIILKDAATYTLFSGTLNVASNTVADTSPPAAATEIGSQTVPIVAKAKQSQGINIEVYQYSVVINVGITNTLRTIQTAKLIRSFFVYVIKTGFIN